jgi:hypothetical protein
MALLAPLPPLVPPDGSGRVTPCPSTSRIATTRTLAACQCAHPPHTVHCRGIDPALACQCCGMSEHLDRSVARIELADLRRLAELAADAEAELFGRNRHGSGRYARRDAPSSGAEKPSCARTCMSGGQRLPIRRPPASSSATAVRSAPSSGIAIRSRVEARTRRGPVGRRPLEALEGTYVREYTRMAAGGDPNPWHIRRVTPAARRAVGQWRPGGVQVAFQRTSGARRCGGVRRSGFHGDLPSSAGRAGAARDGGGCSAGAWSAVSADCDRRRYGRSRRCWPVVSWRESRRAQVKRWTSASSMSGRREWARWLRRSYRLAQMRSARTGWPVAWV